MVVSRREAAGAADDVLYVFMHLEKTGGTTINAHLAEHLGFDDRFVHLGPWGNQTRTEAGEPQPDEWPPERLARLRVVSGHRVHATVHRLAGGRPARYFTFLRRPADLAVSQYNHDAGRLADPPEFWDWYADRGPNQQFRWLCHRLGVARFDEIVERLEDFWFVGITEELDRDLPRVFEAIGVPTAWKNRRVTDAGNDLAGAYPPIPDAPIVRHQEMTDEIAGRVPELDRLDRKLHRWAHRRVDRLRRKYGWT